MTRSYWVFLLAAVLLIASTVALIFGQAWNSTKDTKADIEARNGITVEAIEYPLKLTMNEKRDNGCSGQSHATSTVKLNFEELQ